MCLSSGSSSTTTTVASTPDINVLPEVNDARAAERRRQASTSSAKSTILTSSEGVSSAPSTQKTTLLGS